MNVRIRNTQLLIWTFPLRWVTVNSCYDQQKQKAQGTQGRPAHGFRTCVVLCIAMEAAQLTIFGIFRVIKPLRDKLCTILQNMNWGIESNGTIYPRAHRKTCQSRRPNVDVQSLWLVCQTQAYSPHLIRAQRHVQSSKKQQKSRSIETFKATL